MRPLNSVDYAITILLHKISYRLALRHQGLCGIKMEIPFTSLCHIYREMLNWTTLSSCCHIKGTKNSFCHTFSFMPPNSRSSQSPPKVTWRIGRKDEKSSRKIFFWHSGEKCIWKIRFCHSHFPNHENPEFIIIFQVNWFSTSLPHPP